MPRKSGPVKSVLKCVINGIALLSVVPAVFLFWISCLLLGKEKAFPGWSQAFSLLPGLIGAYVRRAFYRYVLSESGPDSWLSFGTIISHPTTRIGRKVYVGPFCSLGDVTLEEDVLLGSHVSIMNGSGQHGIERLDLPIREQPGVWPHITVGQNTWIGDRAIIMADVGKHCVIGAGSLVSKPIPDYAVAVGVPAKVIRFRRNTEDSGSAEEPVLAPGDVG
jgi:acetyltransferase-like isoleucine patch superfamily enzyme